MTAINRFTEIISGNHHYNMSNPIKAIVFYATFYKVLYSVKKIFFNYLIVREEKK